MLLFVWIVVCFGNLVDGVLLGFVYVLLCVVMLVVLLFLVFEMIGIECDMVYVIVLFVCVVDDGMFVFELMVLFDVMFVVLCVLFGFDECVV